MGWIRRNWFWYTHHSIYIEPTEEEVIRSRVAKKKSRQKLSMLLATAMIMSNDL